MRPAQERRAKPRVSMRGAGFVFRSTGREQVAVRNLSGAGICVRMERPAGKGEPMRVVISLDGKSWMDLNGIVRYSIPVDDAYDCGVELKGSDPALLGEVEAYVRRANARIAVQKRTAEQAKPSSGTHRMVRHADGKLKPSTGETARAATGETARAATSESAQATPAQPRRPTTSRTPRATPTETSRATTSSTPRASTGEVRKPKTTRETARVKTGETAKAEASTTRGRRKGRKGSSTATQKAASDQSGAGDDPLSRRPKSARGEQRELAMLYKSAMAELEGPKKKK